MIYVPIYFKEILLHASFDMQQFVASNTFWLKLLVKFYVNSISRDIFNVLYNKTKAKTISSDIEN